MKKTLGVSAGFRPILFCVIFIAIAFIGSAKSEKPSEKRSQKKSEYKYFYKLDGAYVLSNNRLSVYHSDLDAFSIESHENAKGWKEANSLDNIPSYYTTLIKHAPDAGEVFVRYDNKKWVFDSDFSFALRFIKKSVLESFARTNYPYSYKIGGKEHYYLIFDELYGRTTTKIQRSVRKYAYESLDKVKKNHNWPGITPQAREGIRIKDIEIKRANIDGGTDQEVIARAHYSNIPFAEAFSFNEAEKVNRDFIWIFKIDKGKLKLQYSEEPGSLVGWKIRDFTGDGRADILMDVCPFRAFPAYSLIYCVHGKYLTILVTPYARTPDGVGDATYDVEKVSTDGYRNMVLSTTTYQKSQVLRAYKILEDLYKDKTKTLNFSQMASCLELKPEALHAKW